MIQPLRTYPALSVIAVSTAARYIGPAVERRRRTRRHRRLYAVAIDARYQHSVVDWTTPNTVVTTDRRGRRHTHGVTFEAHPAFDTELPILTSLDDGTELARPHLQPNQGAHRP